MRTATYWIEKYAADGCSGPEHEYVIARDIPSLREARQIVRQHLGVRRLAASRRWGGNGMYTVEAYHDLPRSHPRSLGCGGVAICRECEHD